jgi:hypothetical protein
MNENDTLMMIQHSKKLRNEKLDDKKIESNTRRSERCSITYIEYEQKLRRRIYEPVATSGLSNDYDHCAVYNATNFVHCVVILF